MIEFSSMAKHAVTEAVLMKDWITRFVAMGSMFGEVALSNTILELIDEEKYGGLETHERALIVAAIEYLGKELEARNETKACT